MQIRTVARPHPAGVAAPRSGRADSPAQQGLGINFSRPRTLYRHPRFASKNPRLVPPRVRHQPQADRTEQPHRAAASSGPGLSPLPRPVGLERHSAGNKRPIAVLPLRPRPSEAPLPIPSRFALHSAVVAAPGICRKLAYSFAAVHWDSLGEEVLPRIAFRAAFTVARVGDS
jgi:hypothetical protein